MELRKEQAGIKQLACAAVVGIALLGGLSACSKFKADPAKDSGYLGGSAAVMKEDRDRFPFNRVWVSREAQKKRGSYKYLVVSPVNTSYLSKMDWWQAQSIKNQQDLKQDEKELAQYTRNTVISAFRKDSGRIQIAAKPGPKTLILELAIVELVPSKAWFNAAATAAGFVVPGAGMLSALGKGSIAVEGRVRDAESGKIVMMFADREKDKVAAVNLASMQFYAGAKEAIDDWAEQLVELANTAPSEAVSDSSPFKLIDW